MDEQEFQRLLLLFPVVRTRDYCQAEAQSSGQTNSEAAKTEVTEWQDAWSNQESQTEDVFWDKLRSAAEQKVGPSEAAKFCNAFQKIYSKLVNEDLSTEVVEKFLQSR